jgi:hypothetical protein
MIFSMHAIMVRHPIPFDSEFNEKDESIDEVLNQVIAFLKAGFLAPPSNHTNME